MDERLRILKMIEEGEINVEEGARRLEALAGSAEPLEPAAAPDVPTARPAWVRWVWQVVFWPGVALVAGGGLLVAAVYAWGVAAGWQVLGWWLQRSHWLYVRVQEPEGSNVLVALPVPLGPLGWVLRIARLFVPQLRETGADTLVLALREELRGGRALTVEVNEGEHGEKVRVYIG